MKLNEQQQRVYDWIKLHDGEWLSPTSIGGDLFPPYGHSAWASPKCLALAKRGLISRNKKGWYRYLPAAPLPKPPVNDVVVKAYVYPTSIFTCPPYQYAGEKGTVPATITIKAADWAKLKAKP